MVEEQWYTNKELYEMINDLKVELLETRKVVKEYNELRRDLGGCIQRIAAIEQRGAGKKTVEDAFLRWGGWLVGLGGLVSAIYFATRGGV